MDATRLLAHFSSSLNHPGEATGFRLRHLDDSREIVYLVDHEHGSALDDQLVDLQIVLIF